MTQTPSPKAETKKPGRRNRWLMGCGALLLVLVLIAVTAGLIGRHLWQSEPAYWTRHQVFITETDVPTQQRVADDAFNRVMSELSYSRGYRPAGSGEQTDPDNLGVRTIRLGFEEANAWLAQSLGAWLENRGQQMPAGISNPMLAAEGGDLVAAFRYQKGEVDQVFSVLLMLEFESDGRAVLSINGLRGGRLPLPTQSILDRLPDVAGEAEHSRAIKVLMGEQPFDPILPIDGTRQARIIGMRVDDEGVELTLQAERVRR